MALRPPLPPSSSSFFSPPSVSPSVTNPILSVDREGRSHLVGLPDIHKEAAGSSTVGARVLDPVSRIAPPFETDAVILSREELERLSCESKSQNCERVTQHALAISRLREIERAEYLHQLEQAKSKIAQLETQLETLPAFYTSFSELEIARLQGDNEQLTRQAFALARKLQNARSPDLSAETIGAHSGDARLRSDNRKLLAEVDRLETILASTERETSRLSSELRRLRPYYLHGAPLIVQDVEIVLPPKLAQKPGSRAVLLGDAEAELLLQAGKTHSHVRRVHRVSLDKAIQEQAEEIVQAMVPLPVDTSHPNLNSRLPPVHPPSSSSTPLDSSDPRGTPPSYQLPIPPSLRARQAANTAATEPNDLPSTTRSVFPNSTPLDPSPISLLQPPVCEGTDVSASPKLKAAIDGADGAEDCRSARAQTEEVLSGDTPVPDAPVEVSPASRGLALFGLPTVAPVAGPSSQLPTDMDLTRDPSRDGRENSSSEVRSRAVTCDEPLDGSFDSSGKVFGRTPSALDLLSEAAGAMRSSKDEVQPNNPRSRKPKLDANGEKKARSPYIKWKLEEDEQLLKAVIECGCAWDSVARLCPTRAYHQVRQRFLRGLRSGETLPPELMYLQAAVRKSVSDYESRRKRKKSATRTSAEPTGDADPLLAQYRTSNQHDDQTMDDGDGDAMYDD